MSYTGSNRSIESVVASRSGTEALEIGSVDWQQVSELGPFDTCLECFGREDGGLVLIEESPLESV